MTCIFCKKNPATHNVKMTPACWECWHDRREQSTGGIPLEDALKELDKNTDDEDIKWLKELEDYLNSNLSKEDKIKRSSIIDKE